MNLVAQAESDLEFTLEDKENGFGVDIVLTDTNGIQSPVIVGQSVDIGFSIDVGTGEAIAGGSAEITIRLSTLINAGIEIPGTGWKIQVTFANDVVKNYTLKDRMVDNTLGAVRIPLGGLDVS